VEQVKTPAFETGNLPGLVTRTAWITSDSSTEDGNSRRVQREYLLFRTTEIASVEIEAIPPFWKGLRRPDDPQSSRPPFPVCALRWPTKLTCGGSNLQICSHTSVAEIAYLFPIG
jgi:hypothetical protein